MADDPETDTTIDLEEFEVRADHVDETVLRNHTARGDWFENIHRALVSNSLTLLVGPRGCGKTHMMRYTWLQCIDQEKLPLAVYVSFNRYLRLEPLLKTRSDAVRIFQIWMLARIISSMADVAARISKTKEFDVYGLFGLSKARLGSLIAQLERASILGPDDEGAAANISTEMVVSAIDALRERAGRKRVVLMLDDAALTLTPEYLFEFFDTVRVLKRTSIAPKCSVYPGTTEYGPRFHAHHEGNQVQAWLSVDGPSYHAIMSQIGEMRYPDGTKLSQDVRDLLIFAAFGMPRAYLSLLREVVAAEGQGQATVNNVVRQHREHSIAEFRSLGTKMPRFATIVRIGEELFNGIVRAVGSSNEELVDKKEKQLLIGIDATLTPLQRRMIDLLVEAGLLYEHPEVSHGGPERRYRRFTPHIAALIAVRAFSGKSRGFSPAATVEFLRRRSTKHPVRRVIATLLPSDELTALKLDLPACQVCGTPRMNDTQRFCHACGSKLADPSTFFQLMGLPISKVTNLTEWQRERVHDHGLRTIGDLLSLSDPGTELRKIPLVGNVRAQKILSGVEDYVDEFLS
ncbi:zinc ribbon domain-containing protein [Bradyrhizobium sp. 166]|uniref:hypothetical protein n=1 Tax=Bradyrhizobium sp. 166 TaxID=2782638 RepID=UPI001FF9D307|nr:hypothetical protein [Bradyrhizobium sp. 166]MCK1607255.1 zinc ribbon domain-containing protein [Bradyrhizobium sp. 166]